MIFLASLAWDWITDGTWIGRRRHLRNVALALQMEMEGMERGQSW